MQRFYKPTGSQGLALLILLALLSVHCVKDQPAQVATTEQGEPLTEQIAEVPDDQLSFRVDDKFCVYRIVEITKGSFKKLKPGSVICVFCPSNRDCPGALSERVPFAIVDKNGKTICEGIWTIRFSSPDECLDCPPDVDDRFRFFK